MADENLAGSCQHKLPLIAVVVNGNVCYTPIRRKYSEYKIFFEIYPNKKSKNNRKFMLKRII